MTDQVAGLGIRVDSNASQATTDLKRLGDQAELTEKQTAQLEKEFARLNKQAIASGTAFGNVVAEGLRAATDVVIKLAQEFQRLSTAAGDYKDLEDQFGGSAENYASLAIAAKVAGQSVEQLATAGGKLARGLVGVDDETKNAGAALAALNINIEEFKKLDVASQFELLGKKQAEFADGQQKTNAFMALFGKTGAAQLAVVKELNEEGGRTVILTQEQIEIADAYADRQKKVSATLEEYLKLASTQALPALTALKGAFAEVVLEMLGINKETKNLANNNEIKQFAETVALGFAHILDAGRGVIQVFQLVGTALGGLSLAAEQVRGFQFSAAKETIKSLGSDLDDILQKESFADRVRRQFAKQAEQDRKAAADKAKETPKPELDFDGKDKKDKKDKKVKGESSLRDIIGVNVQDVKNGFKEIIEAYKDGQRVLDALHDANLVDDDTYYQAKQEFLRANFERTRDSLNAENEEYRKGISSQKSTQKDRLDFQKKIDENESKLNEARGRYATDEKILGIQREAQLKKEAQSYRDAEAAAQEYLDTLVRGQQRQVSAVGQSDQQRDRNAGRQQIDDRYNQQIQDLAKQRRDAELAGEGTLTNAQQKIYDDRLELIKRFQSAALSEYEKGFQDRLDAEKDADNGAKRAFQNYIDNAQKSASQIEGAYSSALGGIEDAFTRLATGGKLQFKDLVNSILADLVRIQARQGISSLLQALGAFAGAANAGYNYNGDAGGGNFSQSGADIHGRRAGGGGVDPWKNYIVGEQGPEILRMGKDGGTIVPNHVISAGSKSSAQSSSPRVEVHNYAGAEVSVRQTDDQKLSILLNKAADRGAQAGYNRVVRDHATGTGQSSSALRQRSGLSTSAGYRKRG